MEAKNKYSNHREMRNGSLFLKGPVATWEIMFCTLVSFVAFKKAKKVRFYLQCMPLQMSVMVDQVAIEICSNF